MQDEQERVILVDHDDGELGTASKLPVHREGALHRAFSVFVFNDQGEVLLQRRADGKYHTAGLWSNTCCGHPRPGEETADAAARRLEEEMGFRCDLARLFHFIYRVELHPGLWEHELDHVFVGRYEDPPRPDPREVSDWRWVDLEALRREVAEQPERFTPWLRIVLEHEALEAPV
jgi:isopentenyl-diphosphate Delta-isomerase